MTKQLCLVLSLSLTLGLAGCGSEADSDTGGSGNSDTAQLQGVWVIDAAAIDQFEEFAALPRFDLSLVRGLHKNVFKGQTLTITPDQFRAGNPAKGHQDTVYAYSVMNQDGDNWTLELVRRKGEPNEERSVMSAKRKGDLLLTERNDSLSAYRLQR